MYKNIFFVHRWARLLKVVAHWMGAVVAHCWEQWWLIGGAVVAHSREQWWLIGGAVVAHSREQWWLIGSDTRL
jgi:hypothetical protein